MPIIAKYVLEERRAAREAQQRAFEQALPAPSLPEAEPSPPVEQAVLSAEPTAENTSNKPKKAKPTKKANRPKKQPTGDYENGYCRPPIEHQFDGSRPGPGRPPGSVAQDTIARKHLDWRRTDNVVGNAINVSNRELIYMQVVNAALGGKDRKAMSLALIDAHRLFPEQRLTETEGSTASICCCPLKA